MPSWDNLTTMSNFLFKIKPPKSQNFKKTNSISTTITWKNDSKSKLSPKIKNSKKCSAPWKNSSPSSASNSSSKASITNLSKPKTKPSCLKIPNEDFSTRIFVAVITWRKSKTISGETTWEEKSTLRLNAFYESYKKTKHKKINTAHGWKTYSERSTWKNSFFSINLTLFIKISPVVKNSSSQKSPTILMSRKLKGKTWKEKSAKKKNKKTLKRSPIFLHKD